MWSFEDFRFFGWFDDVLVLDERTSEKISFWIWNLKKDHPFGWSFRNAWSFCCYGICGGWLFDCVVCADNLFGNSTVHHNLFLPVLYSEMHRRRRERPTEASAIHTDGGVCCCWQERRLARVFCAIRLVSFQFQSAKISMGTNLACIIQNPGRKRRRNLLDIRRSMNIRPKLIFLKIISNLWSCERLSSRRWPAWGEYSFWQHFSSCSHGKRIFRGIGDEKRQKWIRKTPIGTPMLMRSTLSKNERMKQNLRRRLCFLAGKLLWYHRSFPPFFSLAEI